MTMFTAASVLKDSSSLIRQDYTTLQIVFDLITAEAIEAEREPDQHFSVWFLRNRLPALMDVVDVAMRDLNTQIADLEKEADAIYKEHQQNRVG